MHVYHLTNLVAMCSEGTDNERKSDKGYENFKIYVQVDRSSESNEENCDNRGCNTTKP